jgi:hypothetical protein
MERMMIGKKLPDVFGHIAYSLNWLERIYGSSYQWKEQENVAGRN